MMPYASAEELRNRLRLAADSPGWDEAAATQTLAAASVVVRTHAGRRLDDYEADEDSLQLQTAKAITLAYASRLYANPEAVMQKRMGSDYSVSFADSSEAATGLTKDERETLARVFPHGRSGTVRTASAFIGPDRGATRRLL